MTLDYYNKNAKEYFDKTISTDNSGIQYLFLEELKSKSKILDLGCGSGRDSKFFIDKGHEVVSIDGSKELAKFASEFIGQPVIIKDFKDVHYIDEFDGIWAMASLLHIPKSDTLEIYINLFRALKTNGIFYTCYKLGLGERTEDNGRFYNDYTEEEFINFINLNFKNVKIIKVWIGDATLNPNEKFLNVLMKKVK
jgi:SAM-dependent methyltransferase